MQCVTCSANSTKHKVISTKPGSFILLALFGDLTNETLPFVENNRFCVWRNHAGTNHHPISDYIGYNILTHKFEEGSLELLKATLTGTEQEGAHTRCIPAHLLRQSGARHQPDSVPCVSTKQLALVKLITKRMGAVTLRRWAPHMEHCCALLRWEG